ncbi:MAG: cation:proton antiporter, partial [Desulfurococcales archaeon]|nr:cation:proton antiporter [Desulfurococcales archaeon]
DPQYTVFYVAMISAAFLGKLMGGGLTSYLVGYPGRAALRIGVGLFPRAEFCIVAAYFAYMHHILGPEAYMAAILIMIFTNFLTPPLLKAVFLSGPETAEVRPRLKVLGGIRGKKEGAKA